MKNKNNKINQSGIGLIEVMVAIVIMAFGLVALGLLHAGLNRSSSESRAATVAAQIANETLEDRRSFGTTAEYMAFDDAESAPETREGIAFTTTENVTRYRMNPDPDGDPATFDGAFEVVGNTEAFADQQAEFKQIVVEVSWTNRDGQQKSVALVDAISSATPQDGLSTAKSLNGQRQSPQVRIRESTEDGVIPIAIGETDSGDGIAAASTNPRPKQYAEGATGTTKFTVDTYIKDQANPLLQRQLDFAYTSCVCKKGTATDTSVSYEPSYWTGVKYSTPKRIEGRPFGIVDTAVDQDQNLCTTCCRDHHDEVSSSVQFDPFRPSDDYTSGDHNHYKSGSTVGSLALAGANDSYLEACRLVRVGGIYSVATDTELENLALLRMTPSSDGVNFTLDSSTINSYADFVKKYVNQAFDRKSENASYPRSGGLPNPLIKVVDGTPTPTDLANEFELADSDTFAPKILDRDRNNILKPAPQDVSGLAARALYVDWLSPEALEKINCIGNTSNLKCVPYKNMDVLELVPFIAVNATQIALWSSSNPEKASVRSDPIPLVRNGGGKTTDFIRGRVTALQTGDTVITARMGRSNSSLINTKATDPDDSSRQVSDVEDISVSSTSDSALRSAFFKMLITDATADTNFSVQNVSLLISSPTVDQPACAVGGTNQTVNQRTCTLTSYTEPMQLEFGNFNYYSCAHLGNKWTFEPVTVRCVLPPSGKIKTPTYDTPQVRNYQLCSVSSPNSQITMSGVTTTDNGLVTEKASVYVSRNGSATLIKTIDDLNPTFTATFKTTCN